MIVERWEGCELARAEIALICMAVPGTIGCDVGGVRGVGVGEELLRDDVVGIELLDHAVDTVAVDVGFGAGARFKVDSDARSTGESALTEGTSDIATTNMDPRMQMLVKVVPVHEHAFARASIGMTSCTRAVLMKGVRRRESTSAFIALELFAAISMGSAILDMHLVAVQVVEPAFAWIAEVRHLRGSVVETPQT